MRLLKMAADVIGIDLRSISHFMFPGIRGSISIYLSTELSLSRDKTQEWRWRESESPPVGLARDRTPATLDSTARLLSPLAACHSPLRSECPLVYRPSLSTPTARSACWRV